MFSKLVQVANKPVCRCNTGVIRRSFAASTKKDKTKEFVKVSLLLGVSIGTCYGTYKYAADIHTHELADEKIFIHTPWLLKKLHKWFPLDCYTPYMVQRVKISQEMKVVLADAFTDMDFVKEEGLNREDGMLFMARILQKDISNEYKEHLENGDYLGTCIKDFYYPLRESLPGLDRIMSLDEFMLFAGDVLSSESISLDELKERIDTVLSEMNVKREKKEITFDISGLRTNFIKPYVKEKYGIDESVVEEYREKKNAAEEKRQRRTELEDKKGIIEYDIKQIYDEIAEEKKSGGSDSKEQIQELYNQIAELKNELKEVKNELYYL